MKWGNSPLLDVAESLLMIPDLFNWLLTGEKSNELTDASTTQFFDPRSQGWATDLLSRLGLPGHILGPITAPGTRLGRLRPEVADAVGFRDVEVVVPGTHDTASAVMAVPALGAPTAQPRWCYISSGTWSLMGVELPAPVITDTCYRLNFTNEGGVGGTIRLLKNLAGLWLVQECRRIWAQAGRQYSWDQLVALASQAPAFRSLINPDDARFLAPKDMPEAIREYCRVTGQVQPDDEGAVIRCALESLALAYRQTLGWLEQLTGGPIATIHIVGGGTNNRLLCQMAADACHRLVIAGPVEATAAGNVMMQAQAAGDVQSIAAAREVIGSSFDVQRYEPHDSGAWDEAFARFRSLFESDVA
jgi:rhamnulokinase